MTPAEDPRAREVEILVALMLGRYGSRLTPAEVDQLRRGVEANVRAAQALRAVRLENAEEPFPPFAPFRAEP
jgi:hypothetical protein